MELQEHLAEIQTAIREGRFLNEASVSQGVVLRILQSLGWPVFDSQTVCPEYMVEGRRVDFALCHPKLKPAVFIEVKQVGKGEGADKQLFEYAFHLGVPMAVLTDGQEWHFYLPAERGCYEERRVYKLDLLERDVEESSQRLNRYLSYANVRSGDSMNFARTDYKDIARKREIKDTLSIAWRKLIEDQDEILIELIADKVESLCGYKPDVDVVAKFLVPQSNLFDKTMSSVNQVRNPVDNQARTGSSKQASCSTQNNRVGFIFKQQRYEARNARDVFIKVMELFSNNDKSFPERFASRPRHGKKRRYIARTKEELYPGRSDLCESNSHRLKCGWWVGTNYSKSNFEIILKMACEVAGLNYGSELIVNLGN